MVVMDITTLVDKHLAMELTYRTSDGNGISGIYLLEIG